MFRPGLQRSLDGSVPVPESLEVPEALESLDVEAVPVVAEEPQASLCELAWEEVPVELLPAAVPEVCAEEDALPVLEP